MLLDFIIPQNEGKWINFEAVLSTSADQIAIAPGCLVRDWNEGGRHFFHYKTNQSILPIYLITSGRYAVKRDRWHDIDIEIYHHPPHTANLDRMIQAVKSSLDYFTKNFSPYQFPHVRIVEIPRYADFAQSFPNTIAYSETVGFIAKVDPNDSENIDYPFYTTAHEMAHQWWGHQVISAPVQGASMLSESLAQYSALMVLKHEYGPLHMRKFLKHELDRYLQGRNLSSKKESPLAWNNLEEYVHYCKGSLAFYALEDQFGEKWLNEVLQNYVKDVAFQQPPFTRAIKGLGHKFFS